MEFVRVIVRESVADLPFIFDPGNPNIENTRTLLFIENAKPAMYPYKLETIQHSTQLVAISPNIMSILSKPN